MASNTADSRGASLTVLSDLISKAMDEKDISILGLADKIEITYEHMRRIVRGVGVPSITVLKEICRELGLDFKQAKTLAVAAKIQNKYGDIPLELAGKKPDLHPIERVWDDLTDDQKRDAVTMIEGWAKRNKALR